MRAATLISRRATRDMRKSVTTLTTRQRAWWPLAAAVLVAAAVTAGCQNGVTGPSLSATVQNVSLQPTVAGLQGGQNVCCCHLAGQLTNGSSIPVHAELIFTAKGASGQTLGTALNILEDVPAGATRSFVAAGITAACKDLSLSQILADKQIRLKGLFFPD
jgi:hypothetical protein